MKDMIVGKIAYSVLCFEMMIYTNMLIIFKLVRFFIKFDLLVFTNGYLLDNDTRQII
jgi:hypothetical protein